MSRIKGKHNARTSVQQKHRRAQVSGPSPSRQSGLGKAIRNANRRINKWRNCWVVQLISSVLIIAATLSSVLYQVLNDRKRVWDDKLNDYRLGAFVQQERHGCRTMEVLSADPKETVANHVDMALRCTLVSLGTKAIQLTRYKVDVLFDGHWMEFTEIVIPQAQFLVIHPASKPLGEYINVLNNCLVDVIHSRALTPGAPMDGWMFLTIYGESDHRFILEQIRLMAWDIDGRAYTILPKRIGEQDYQRRLNSVLRVREQARTDLDQVRRRRRIGYR